MASSQPPFDGTGALFGAHQPTFAASQSAETGNNVASYFGAGQESPTSNPFAFVSAARLVEPAGHGSQQNYPSAPVGPPVNIQHNAVVDGNTPRVVTSGGMWSFPNQQQPPFHTTDPNPYTHSNEAPKAFSNTAFAGQPTDIHDDPFELLHQPPRSKSSQAQIGDNTNASVCVPYSGSSSAPVTSVVGTLPQEQDDLGGTLALNKLMSLPTVSSVSSIQRPPLSPVLPHPLISMTNATLPTNQCLPLVQSYPHLAPTNATNATGDSMAFASAYGPQYVTNALNTQAESPLEPFEHGGLAMKEEPARQLEPRNVTNSQLSSGNNVEMSTTEKDYLAQGKDKMHGVGLLEGGHSLSSSLNHSKSSLLDSQEDITQHSPVTILPPAPESRPQAPPSSSPQPSQQFPPSRTVGDLEHMKASSDQVAELKTEIETPTQTQAVVAETFLPPPPNSSLPTTSLSLPSQPEARSLSLGPGVNPVHSLVPSYHQPPPELPSLQGEVLRTEVGIPTEAHPPNSSVPSSLLLQSSQLTTALSVLQPLMQPQSVAQTQHASSVVPPPSSQPELQVPSALSLPPQPGLQSAQPGLQPPPLQVSPVYLPTQPAPSTFQLNSATHEGTNASIYLSASQDGTTNVANAQQVQPAPKSVGQGPVENVHTESGVCSNPSEVPFPLTVSLANDNSNVHRFQPAHVSSQLPPGLQNPLVLTNASQTQHSIASNVLVPSSQTFLQSSVPSNADPLLPEAPTTLSNAHPPPSEATTSVRGTLSNANLSQFMPRALVSGVQPPPLTATQASSGTRPQHVPIAMNTAPTVALPPIDNNLPHNYSVPLHQAPLKDNLPSTPDSVFSQATSEAPLASTNVVTGVPVLPHSHPSQTGPVSVPTTSAVPHSAHSTQTQPSIPTQPLGSAPPPQVQPHTVSAAGLVNVAASQPPARIPATTAHMVNNPQPMAAPVAHVYTTVAPTMPPVSLVYSSRPHASSSVAMSDIHRQLPVHPQVVNSTAVHVAASSHSVVTAPVTLSEQRPPATTDHLRNADEKPPVRVSAPPQRQPSLPPSSSHQLPHHGRPEHSVHHPPHGYDGRDDMRLWRHTAELRHRERYEPYYGEDMYEYERHGHYYEDPYYGGYYRPWPGSRAPHSYFPDPYEHDPYPPYYRQVREYDPYTGKYYYVEDPYLYPNEYDVYHHGYYEHPRELVHGHPQVLDQKDPQKYAHEHLHGHELPSAAGAVYPDQSTIDGPQGVFEEGGTFFESPDTRGGRGIPPDARHLYPDASYYGQEAPVQPDWGSSEASGANQPQEPPIVLRRTPEQFACPHVRASFAPGGTLVMVLPHNVRAFQRPEVELSHVTELVSDSVHANFVRAVSEFPGPLMPGETPKSVAVSYATKQAEHCRVKTQAAEEGEESDAESAKELSDEALLWDFLVLLCQQNGVVVASDISELLTREKMMVIPTRTHMGSGDQEEALENIRRLLIDGRKRDALELACSQCLWGHALMLATTMDEQSRTYVINRFTASLVTTDPLSTFYTLMLGRVPSAVKPEGLRRAGSWRPHLAMILANRTNKLDNSSVVTLGDSLLESGRLCAAHFCYHMADIPFGAYGNISSKYMLLGTQNSELAMGVIPRPEELRKMEIFEYAMSLGKLDYVLPHFQVFKFLLALRLTQFGMVAKAFKYCEQIAVFIGKSPGKFSSTLLHVLDQLSTQLHHLNHPHGVVETQLPSWLLQLQQISTDIMAGNYNYTSSARSTPSPTFSSVSQAYGQPRHSGFVGQTRNQFLRVPGNGYKAGSVDSSTAASSKEGSMVGGLPATSQQESYQPSNLLVAQQPGRQSEEHQAAGYSVQPLQEHGQVPVDAPYSQSSQQPPAPEETAPQTAVEGSGTGSTSAGVPYYPAQGQANYAADYSVTATVTSGGDAYFGVSGPPVSSEQYSTAVGSSGEFGVTSSIAGNEQPPPFSTYQQLPYGSTTGDQTQQFQPYQPVYGSQQGHTEGPQQFGYGVPPQPTTDPSQGALFQPTMQPSASEAYSWGTNVWDQQLYAQQTPGAADPLGSSGYSGASIATNDTGVAGATSDANSEGREASHEKDEEKEKTQESKEGKK